MTDVFPEHLRLAVTWKNIEDARSSRTDDPLGGGICPIEFAGSDAGHFLRVTYHQIRSNASDESFSRRGFYAVHPEVMEWMVRYDAGQGVFPFFFEAPLTGVEIRDLRPARKKIKDRLTSLFRKR